MRVNVTRSGGLAGGIEGLGGVDTAALDPTRAAAVESAVAGVERLAAGDQPVGADLYRYTVEVEDDRGGRRTLVLLHEGDPGVPLPQPLQALLDVLGG